MKLFRFNSQSQSTNGEDSSLSIDPSTALTVQSQSMISADADGVRDDIDAPTPPLSGALPPVSTMTLSETTKDDDTSSVATKKKNKNKKRKLHKLFRRENKEDKVSEARKRAAKMLEPPPIRESRLARLRELKHAKSMAEERAEERSRSEGSATAGGGSQSFVRGCGSSVASANTCETTLISDDEQRAVVRRDAAVFLASFFLHMALLPWRHYPLLPLVLICLQSISLWGLLNSVLVYAFDNIDFGQMDLVRNMSHAKNLFVEEVRKYSKMVSPSIAVVSVLCAVGRGAVRWSTDRACRLLVHLSSEGSGTCDRRDVAAEAWEMRAFRISSFVTSRLGVFVLSLLFLGHILLPKATATT